MGWDTTKEAEFKRLEKERTLAITELEKAVGHNELIGRAVIYGVTAGGVRDTTAGHREIAKIVTVVLQDPDVAFRVRQALIPFDTSLPVAAPHSTLDKLVYPTDGSPPVAVAPKPWGVRE